MQGRHKEFFPTVLGVFALVAGYGIVNDEIVAAIAPTHFNVYNPHYFPFEAPWVQALCFGLIGSGGLGLAWGIALYWAGQTGSLPKIGKRSTFISAGVWLLVTAVAAWVLGWHVWKTNITPFPDYFYPGGGENLNITQTVQLTNDVVGIAGAIMFIFGYWTVRIWRAPPIEPAS